MPNGSILWGASSSGYTYANTLTFGYPLYDWVTDRVQRPGSVQIQSPSGTEDSWITGRDYQLTAQVRWIPDNSSGIGGTPARTLVAGPVQWQDFLDYARAKNTFRFVPNASVPNFFVDGCYWVEPITGFGQNNAVFQRDLQAVIRNPSVDFTNALRGIMLEYAPGQSLTDPLTYTFTRADATTCATYRDAAGNIQIVPANVLRDRHYINGVRTTLLEAARTNLIENGDYENDAVGTTALSAETVARVTAPGDVTKYGTASLKCTTINGANSGVQFKTRAGTRIVVTNTTAYTFSTWVYGDTPGVGKTVKLNMDWYNNVPAFLSTSSSASKALVAGWQRLTFTATSPGTAAFVLPWFAQDNAQGVWNFWLDVVQFEAGTCVSSEIPTTTAALTRAADALSVSLPTGSATPQVGWVYYKFVELGTNTTGALTGLWAVGRTTASAMYVFNSPGFYSFEHDESSGVTSQMGTAPTYGDTVELLALLGANGSVQLLQSINGGAPTSAALSAANALGTTWSTAEFRFNERTTGGGTAGLQGLIDARMGSGSTVNTIPLARVA